MRVVIDTNVIVSAFLSPNGDPARVFEQWELQTFELVVSESILAECQRALLYRHAAVRHEFTSSQIAEVMDGIRQLALVVEPEEMIEVIIRDPADNRIIECAVAGAAQYIVSGDPHLLDLQEYRGIQILSPRSFLAVLSEERDRKT